MKELGAFVVYRMNYDRNCPIQIGKGMIVTNPDEWKKRVYNYVTEYKEDFLSSYEKDMQNWAFGMEMTFEHWVDYYLEHMVWKEIIFVDDYRGTPLDNIPNL